MSEERLIGSFKKILIGRGVDVNKIETAEKNKSTIMDFNFINPITDTYISLEAKVFNDVRSNSSFFLSLFGKVIKGRHLNKFNKNCKDKNVEYGFLFEGKDKDVIKMHFDYIEDDDWRLFCSNYNVKHVFFVDNNSYEVFKAEDFKVSCRGFTKQGASKKEPEIIDDVEKDYIEKRRNRANCTEVVS